MTDHEMVDHLIEIVTEEIDVRFLESLQFQRGQEDCNHTVAHDRLVDLYEEHFGYGRE